MCIVRTGVWNPPEKIQPFFLVDNLKKLVTFLAPLYNLESLVNLTPRS